MAIPGTGSGTKTGRTGNLVRLEIDRRIRTKIETEIKM
jgi:hypothetical protein